MMEDQVIDGLIRRSNRNLALIALTVGVAAVLANWGARGYWSRLFGNEVVVDAAAILDAESWKDLPRGYVWVEGDAVESTGWNREKGGKIVSELYALSVGGRRLLVQADPGEARHRIGGQFTFVHVDLRKQKINLPPDRPGAAARTVSFDELFLPVLLDAQRSDQSWFICIVTSLLSGVALWLLVLLARRLLRDDAHPLVRDLVGKGDLFEVKRAVDEEVAGPDTERFGALTLTPNWLVYRGGVRARVWPVEDVVWAYVHEIMHFAVFLPVGKQRSLLIWNRKKRRVTVPVKKRDLEPALAAVHRRAPWIVMGFTPDQAKDFRGNWSSVVQAVDERRREFQSNDTDPA